MSFSNEDMLGGDPVEAAASASVMAKLADTVNETESEGDSAHHGGSHREKDGKESKRGKAEGKGGDTEKDEKERGESQRVEGVAGAVGGAEGRAEGVQGDGDTAALRDLIAAAVRRMIDRLRHRTEQTEQTCDEELWKSYHVIPEFPTHPTPFFIFDTISARN